MPHFALGQEEQVAWAAKSLPRSAAQIRPPDHHDSDYVDQHGDGDYDDDYDDDYDYDDYYDYHHHGHDVDHYDAEGGKDENHRGVVFL